LYLKSDGFLVTPQRLRELGSPTFKQRAARAVMFVSNR
jgi:hypothetical protein